MVAARKRRACTGRVQLEAGGKRVCAECTSNMYFMPVTLDASKLSGWLNADASCRVERRACDVGSELRATGGGRAWDDGGAIGLHTERVRLKSGLWQGTRGAHVEHIVHGRDLGRVEVQRLVERICALPSRKEGMRCGARCGLGSGRTWGGGGASGAYGEGPTTG